MRLLPQKIKQQSLLSLEIQFQSQRHIRGTLGKTNKLPKKVLVLISAVLNDKLLIQKVSLPLFPSFLN